MRWNWRRWAIYGIGAVFIALSVWSYVRLTEHYKNAVTMMMTLKPVRFIQAGEVIGDELLQRVPIAIIGHDADAYVETDDVRGKTALVPIGLNEEFARWKLTDVAIVPGDGESYHSFKTDKLQNNSNMVRRGDLVDVWVEFESPKWLRDAAGDRKQVGSVKVIRNLLVAGVKSAEGAEVTDSTGIGAVLGAVRGGTFELNRSSLAGARSKPNGVPDINTYIMRDEIYDAYALASLGGRIRLALAGPGKMPKPNLSTKTAGLTEMFIQLRDTDIFNKVSTQKEYEVERIVRNEVLE